MVLGSPNPGVYRACDYNPGVLATPEMKRLTPSGMFFWHHTINGKLFVRFTKKTDSFGCHRTSGMRINLVKESRVTLLEV
jgi:hypothetical protein